MDKLKIAVIGRMPKKGYSGGRYCAWVMAEALAYNGNDVYVIINSVPEFSRDFKDYSGHGKIHVILTKNFYRISVKEKALDYVICIPSINGGEGYYYACRAFALKKKAKFAFINFETPNWYNEYAEMNRPEEDYVLLREICKYGCMVISISKEGQKYAEKYYDRYPLVTKHCTWSPPINSKVADSVNEDKRNQVLIFLRIQDKHKGGNDFFELLGEYMRGMECVCIVGNGLIDSDFLLEAERKAEEFGISLRFEKSVDDYRKFQEIKRSRLLLYPSYFEGYGYPPVESLYCGTPCIVYDLPVLREISDGALNYCEMGNVSMMREKAGYILRSAVFNSVCVDTAEFTKQALRLQNLLEDSVLKCKSMIKVPDGSKIMLLKFKYMFCDKCERAYRWICKKIPRVPDIIQYCIDHDIIISERLDMDKERWKLIKGQLKDKQVFVWGCGRGYYSIYPKYKKRIALTGIIDRDPEKIGEEDRFSKDLVIQSPKILQQFRPDDVAVIIANKEGVDEIIQQLEEIGIRNYHSLCMMELNSCGSRIYRRLENIKRFVRTVRTQARVPDIIRYCVDHDIIISERLDMDKERWNLVKGQLEDKKVFVWGYGRAYYSIYPKYKKRITLVGIIDKDPEKIGKKDRFSKDLVIQSPKILQQFRPDDITVIIANKEGVDEIIQQLEEIGVRNYHSLCMMELNSGSSRIYRRLEKIKRFARTKVQKARNKTR